VCAEEKHVVVRESAADMMVEEEQEFIQYKNM
jgi:hypothetical protein